MILYLVIIITSFAGICYISESNLIEFKIANIVIHFFNLFCAILGLVSGYNNKGIHNPDLFLQIIVMASLKFFSIYVVIIQLFKKHIYKENGMFYNI